MSLNIKQTLQKGVTAHKAGKFQEAEHLYRAILAEQPSHPDANYNLGSLIVSFGMLEKSLPFFKKALESNPKNGQFWLSYLKVLHRLGRQDTIETVLSTARQAGMREEDIINLRKKLAQKQQKERPLTRKSIQELYRLYNAGQIDEALVLGERLSNRFTDDPNVFNILGAINISSGNIEDAVANYKKAINIKSDFLEAHNNLGLSLKKLARTEAALTIFKKAVMIDPKSEVVHYNLANTLQELGQHEQAIVSFNRAIKLNPESAASHNNLANSLRALSRTEEAITSYKNALKSQPDFTEARINIGNSLEELGNYTEAFAYYDSADTPITKYKALQCLYRQKHYSEFTERLLKLTKISDKDIGVAAVSAYVSHQLGHEDPYPFCRNPLDFFSVTRLSKHCGDVDLFIDGILKEAKNIPLVWEPSDKTTKLGFQSDQTIFSAGDNCVELARMIGNEIKSYHSKYNSEKCTFINSWPRHYNLKGWFVRLEKKGHQRSHMHPSGWLSGVVYLKTVDPMNANEGALELSIHGDDLPILNENYPRRIYQPKKGDIILFPSSLFHRTIPFNSDVERCVIAFDLIQKPI